MNNDINKLVPELRFPEFVNQGEWQQKTLNEITSSIFDGTHQTPKYTENGIPFFSVENLISGNKNKFISEEDHIIATNKNKPEKFDLLITRIGNIGFPKIIDWDYEFSIYVTLAVIKKSKQFNSYYLYSFIQSDFYQKEIKSKSLLNATPCKINMDELRKTKILLPPDREQKEQKKIADCFSSLNELLSAYSKKLESLKSHKKGLMQNLFPQEDKKVPKLRFKKFEKDGEWEEKLIEDFFDVGSSKRVLQENWTSEGVPFYRTRELVSLSKNAPFGSEIFISEKLFSELSKNYGIPTEGDFLISGVGTLGISYQVKKNDRFYFKDGNVLWFKIKKKLCSSYFKFCFQSNHIQGQIIAQTSLSTVGTYTIQNAKKTKFWYPSSLNEQQEIADTLSSLDDLIKEQSNKIEQLNFHKKGLMQRLFPNISN
ncbi:restriction endonuclease subunit S [Pedobacter immunditicola]|uniref:restriction endonuclease subunit S n=1 Tax=Pedobacter immunditicola TaxID=3133440 RepID=UPI0030B6A225